ncbi:putative glycoside hydrolase [Gilvimarinus xylanilyticus]|uniref:Glycoside hydrolase n=1 Tax=Gilvimarinus xylanilyticus TaxID=2944139 RepID=A0A9X2HSE3_9GAMM|nr:putative glycoside hydrolase [Gilvimarinus xylanilyticus]MCP8897693.1 putative glycoside hydrolase [Gilvimarinus xylanilyticus]
MLRFFLTLVLTAYGAFCVAQDSPNPNFVYFTQGKTPGNWQWILSDPGNWWMPIDDSGGSSANGKITLSNAGDEDFPGAVKLKWKRSDDWGAATISGGQVDLAKFEQAAEIAIAMRVMSKVPSVVNVKMACGEGCEAEVNVAENLKQMPRGQWMALPLALDCFTANGLDLSKLNWPFAIGTSGQLELDIVEISLAPLAEGDEGCVPNA